MRACLCACVCDSARVCVCICISDALALFSPLFSSLFRCVSVYARPFSVTAKCTMINNDQDGGEDVAVVRALSLPLTLPLALPSVSRTTGSGRAQGRPGQCRHTFTHTQTNTLHTHAHIGCDDDDDDTMFVWSAGRLCEAHPSWPQQQWQRQRQQRQQPQQQKQQAYFLLVILVFKSYSLRICMYMPTRYTCIRMWHTHAHTHACH